MYFLKPVGRSVYNALQMTLKQNVTNPMRGLKAANFQVSYSLSNFSSTGGQQANGVASDNDQDFVIIAADKHPSARYFGPTLLDATTVSSHRVWWSSRIPHWADLSLRQPIDERAGCSQHRLRRRSSGRTSPGTEAFGISFPGTKLGAFDRSSTPPRFLPTLSTTTTLPRQIRQLLRVGS